MSPAGPARARVDADLRLSLRQHALGHGRVVGVRKVVHEEGAAVEEAQLHQVGLHLELLTVGVASDPLPGEPEVVESAVGVPHQWPWARQEPESGE